MRKLFKACEIDVLRRLDTTVYSGAPAIVETQFGDVKVRKAWTPGYVAEIGDGEIPEAFAYGPTPSIAFFNLGDALKREQETEKEAAKVISFRQAA